MEDRLYLIVVNQTTHYYVRCPQKIIESWLTTIVHEQDVSYTEIRLSDLDEINHIHFC